MANPQLEHGYTKVANEIFEALCRIRVPGETRQVVDVIIRKTYGYNKKEDSISLSQFCLLTGMRRGDVCRAINKAISMNLIKVISKEANGKGNIYCIIKDFDSWKSLAKKRRGVAKKLIAISKKANLLVAKKRHTKERVKERVKETNTAGPSPAGYNPLGVEIIKAFEGIDPKNRGYYGNTTQRGACNFLIEEYGLEEVLRRITALPRTNKVPYFPSIFTPAQLRDKWVALEEAVHRKRGELKDKKEILI